MVWCGVNSASYHLRFMRKFSAHTIVNSLQMKHISAAKASFISCYDESLRGTTMTTKTKATIQDLYEVPHNRKAEIVNGEILLISPTGSRPGRRQAGRTRMPAFPATRLHSFANRYRIRTIPIGIIAMVNGITMIPIGITTIPDRRPNKQMNPPLRKRPSHVR
jgi:hypothetical protein